MLTTNQKGAIAETAIAHECVKRGIGVARPLDDERYDLILDLHPRLLRVQCKWAVQRGDVVVVRLYSTRRGPAGAMITRRYTADEVDGFAAYCPGTGRCYFLPTELAVHPQIQLRLVPTRNNQRAGVRWARDFDLGATLSGLQGP